MLLFNWGFFLWGIGSPLSRPWFEDRDFGCRLRKMKFSLKLPEDQQHHHNQNHHNNPLIKAKIPISMFNQPFLTSIASTTSSPSPHLSFSLSSNFSSGPSIKLSYSPTSTSSTPFSVSLKSGLGVFGSPNQSPLVFTAHFSPSPTNPTFSLHFQFGNFSLKKTTFSNPGNDRVSGSHSNDGVHLDSGSHSSRELGDEFVAEGSSSVWQDLKLEPCGGKDGFLNSDFMEKCGVHLNSGIGSDPEKPFGWKNGGKDGVLSGIAVMARTVLPVTKRLVVNMRWGVNFPAKLGTKFPYLALNKIGIERVEEVKEEKKKKKKKSDESDVADMELLKGMFFWMRKDLELLEKENREMKQCLEQIKLGASGKQFRGESDVGQKKVLQQPPRESSVEFEQWRNKKNVKEENDIKEPKKSTNQANDLESELQRAIMAAST